MTIVPDPINTRRLAIVKQLLARGISMARGTTTAAARMLSVLALDAAIETMMKAGVSALDPSKKTADSHSGLLQQLDALLQSDGNSSLSTQPHILRVRRVGNETQHLARIPSDDDVTECVADASAALDDIASTVFGIILRDVTLISHVRNDQVRQYLSEANAALATRISAQVLSYPAQQLNLLFLGKALATGSILGQPRSQFFDRYPQKTVQSTLDQNTAAASLVQAKDR